jgi:hypothetical protein
MWRGGCIIRSVFLGNIKAAYDKNPDLVCNLIKMKINLLFVKSYIFRHYYFGFLLGGTLLKFPVQLQVLKVLSLFKVA